MKWEFKMVVLIVEWSLFLGGLKAGFYSTSTIENRKLLAELLPLQYTTILISPDKHIGLLFCK